MAVPKSATILHVDMDAFFASVEILEDPSLRGKPVIVGGDGSRGVVASCSYEARFYGVRSAMPSMRAKRLCPHAVFVPGHHDLYGEYSRRMHEVFASFTPLVEGISLDEAFLDVSGAVRLFGEPTEIAHHIRQRLQEDLGLHASVGVATTKHVAKLASVAAKPVATRSGPAEGKGVVVVEEAQAIEFLHRLPVRALWGVGPATAAKLERLGVDTVGRLARLPLERLEYALGRASAQHLYDLAWNRDDRGVEPDREMKSIGHEQTFAHDLFEDEEISRQLVRLADATSSRMRKATLAGRTITLKVRFGDFRTITRSKTLPESTTSTAIVTRVARELIDDVDVSLGVRLLGVSVSNLEEMSSVSTWVTEQLSFDSTASSEDENDLIASQLDEVVDLIRERYGEAAVVPGVLASGVRGPDVFRRGEQQWGPTSNPLS